MKTITYTFSPGAPVTAMDQFAAATVVHGWQDRSRVVIMGFCGRVSVVDTGTSRRYAPPQERTGRMTRQGSLFDLAAETEGLSEAYWTA
ncbi:MAG TPA: hypothetical protein VN519_06665 [Bryobacteraceae bacterium]|nr:hypothetical protein [Bryobacteraceae bacterium]